MSVSCLRVNRFQKVLLGRLSQNGVSLLEVASTLTIHHSGMCVFWMSNIFRNL